MFSLSLEGVFEEDKTVTGGYREAVHHHGEGS